MRACTTVTSTAGGRTGKSRRSRAAIASLAAVAAAALAGASLTACSSSGGSTGGSGGEVTVTVMGLPPTSDPVDRKAFQAQVAAFEKQNPAIHVVPTDTPWDPQTFTARLAGGNAPNLLRVPLTEPPGLIQRHQVRDLSTLLKTLPEYSVYNPKLLIPNKDATGRVYGITEPSSAYTLGLIYSRSLFTRAGLDPDKPPTTWEQVRADAKQIHDRTGAVGYAESTTENAGGWHLTAEVYSRGGTMEQAQGGKQVAAFDAQPARDALQLLHEMRFTDDSMGTDELQNKTDVESKFAAGKIGMMLDGGVAVSDCVQQFGGKLQDIAWGAMPGTATLLGGASDMVTATSTPEQAAAAIKWADYEYIHPFYDAKAAAALAKKEASDPKILIGIPTVPAFGSRVTDAVNAATKPYVNVPVKNYQPYVTGQAGQQLLSEPPVDAQNLYAALDPVMQAVLTKPDADVNSLLTKASQQVAAQLESDQQ